MHAPSLPRIEHEALRFVVANMRACDRREIEASSYRMDDEDRVSLYMQLEDYTFCAMHRGRPAAIIGATPIRPGVWSVFAFGTDDFTAVAPTLTKFCLRGMVPDLIKAGAHRAQADSIEGHDTAHRWLEAMGYENEGAMPGYGSGGETFYRFARTELSNVRT